MSRAMGTPWLPWIAELHQWNSIQKGCLLCHPKFNAKMWLSSGLKQKKSEKYQLVGDPSSGPDSSWSSLVVTCQPDAHLLYNFVIHHFSSISFCATCRRTRISRSSLHHSCFGSPAEWCHLFQRRMTCDNNVEPLSLSLVAVLLWHLPSIPLQEFPGGSGTLLS